MDSALWAEIKRLYGVEHRPIAEIARRLRLDRKTVRRAAHAERVPVPSKPLPRPSLLDPYKPYIQERLKRYPRLAGTALWSELKKQGYPGKIRILTEYLQSVRGAAKEVFLRIETPPGEQAQADWANIGAIKIGHALRKLSAFVMILSHCRLLYVEFTLSQCLEDFLQCHLNAFRFFGGVPKKILYDNLKQVVLWRSGADLRFNPQFMEFAGVYGFEPVPCNVARGNEKGKVENSIYYLRVNFLAGRTLLWPEVNDQVRDWLACTANVRLHRTTHERPVERWEREKPFLMPLESRAYDTAIVRPVRSSSQAIVRWDGNLYSVPAAYAYQTLLLKASSHEVWILEQTQEIARHPRSYGRGELVSDPKHFEGIKATKRKFFQQEMHKRFLELGPIAKTFLDGIINTEQYPTPHLKILLDLVSSYGKEPVLSAIEHAITCNAYGANYAQNILLQRRMAQGPPEVPPLEIPQRPDWNALDTEDPDLSIYDEP